MTIESFVMFNGQGTIAHAANAVQPSATVSTWILHSDHPMNDGIMWLANLKVELKLVGMASMRAMLGTYYYSTWHGCVRVWRMVGNSWGLVAVASCGYRSCLESEDCCEVHSERGLDYSYRNFESTACDIHNGLVKALCGLGTLYYVGKNTKACLCCRCLYKHFL